MKRYVGELCTDCRTIVADECKVAHLGWSEDQAVASDSDGLLGDLVLVTTSGGKTVTTFENEMPCTRTVDFAFTAGEGALKAGTVEVFGTNIDDKEITESHAVTSSTTALTGTKAFKTVTKITFPQIETTGVTVDVGWTDKLGLPFALDKHTAVLASIDGATEGTPPVLTIDTTDFDVSKNTIDLNTALSGKVVDVYLFL